MKKYSLEVIDGDKKQIYKVETGNLHSIMLSLGYQISAPCGGNGRCGKCKVNVDGEIVLACKTLVDKDMKVEIKSAVGEGLLSGIERETSGQISEKQGVSIALDIGTTTLAFYFLDNINANEIWAYSCLNPQCAYGGDVVSRISRSESCMEMFEVLKNTINQTIETFLKNNIQYKSVTKIVACGNTTMSHIFAMENPSSLGKFPFTPVFLKRREFLGEQLKINAETIILLPSISAFVGGDITSGIMATNMQNGTNLLIDIGTNGEIVACKNGEIFATATAAGPAFEGGNISCGVGGIDGAISQINIENEKIEFSTIGNKPAIGICGSGLFDCVSALLKDEVLDETGYMQEDFKISENISITKKDIREFQVGKSAIASGVKVLLYEAGIAQEEIENVYLAGGMGFYLDKNAIANVGLLSKTLASKIISVGNSAGSGAKACLINSENIKQCDEICNIAKVVDLGSSEQFNNEFAMNMMLEVAE